MSIQSAITRLLGLGLLAAAGSAGAAPVMCQSLANNHMLVDTAYVSGCIDAGMGNIGQGNPANDDFLNQFAAPTYGGYTTIGAQSFTQSGSSGTFSVSAAAWSVYADLFIGFKFGTGNQPDEWFVYQLADMTVTGAWDFVNVHGRGGGLSHVTMYGRGQSTRENLVGVPEPGAFALAALALLALAVVRRPNRTPRRS